MILHSEEFVDLKTPSGTMRAFVYRPAAPGKYPGIVFYSEIYQVTGPIRRMAATLAGHGFVVAAPEIFHEFEPLGTALQYNQDDTDKGNKYKISKPIEAYDADNAAVVDYLKTHPSCTQKIGAMGVCIGGHLSFRAAMHPDILASACFYATDIHKRSLGSKGDNSLDRFSDIKGEVMMVWGRQDPHIPDEGRALIYQKLVEAKVSFTWHEFNAAHAFMRDEGHKGRYDPALALLGYRLSLDLFQRTLT